MGTRVTTTAIKSKCKTKKRRVGSFQDGRFLKWLEHLAKVGGSGLRTEQEGGAAHSPSGEGIRLSWAGASASFQVAKGQHDLCGSEAPCSQQCGNWPGMRQGKQ